MPTSFSWVSETAADGRVLVLLDDDVPKMMRGGRLPPSQRVLRALYEGARTLPGTRAVGCFTLPSSLDDVTRVRDEVADWLRQFAGPGVRFYFLVDCFFGQDSEVPFGSYWRVAWEKSPTGTAVAPVAKYKFLSAGFLVEGAPGSGHESEVPFLKGALDEHIIHHKTPFTADLLAWLDAASAPDLDHLWEVSARWFAHPPADGMKHTVDGAAPPAVAAVVRAALRLPDLPDAWFQDGPFWSLNESLKGMCGVHYSGTSESTDHKNLTLGSVALIAAMAQAAATGSSQLVTQALVPDTWMEKTFLKGQSKDASRASALALFELFRGAFEAKAGRPGLRSCLVNTSRPATPVLNFDLDWSATAGERDKALANTLDGYVRKITTRLEEVADRPDELRATVPSDSSKTAACVLRWWLMALPSDVGFGHPGSVRLDETHLIFETGG